MRKVLVIYDNTGTIYSMSDYSDANTDDVKIPQGIPSLFVDIPEGAVIDKIDMTDKNNPKAIFTYLPDTDLGKAQKDIKQIKEEIEELQLAAVEQYGKSETENGDIPEQLTELQLAVAELYNKIVGG